MNESTKINQLLETKFIKALEVKLIYAEFEFYQNIEAHHLFQIPVTHSYFYLTTLK